MEYDKEKVDEYTSGEKIDESDRKTMRFCIKACIGSKGWRPASYPNTLES